MKKSLSQRQKEYESVSDIKLTKRLPVIIRVDGKNFSGLTRNLPKPYCPKMLSLMTNTMLESAKVMQGAVFAYQQSDEITFVLRNDQSIETEAWLNNRIQKLSSLSASVVTATFNNLYHNMSEKPNIKGAGLFDSRVFNVPSNMEVVNNLIFRQQDCMKNSINLVSEFELGAKYGTKKARNMIYKKTASDRKRLLFMEFGTYFETDYHSAFRNGVAIYKAPRLIKSDNGNILRYKWHIDYNLPDFSQEQDFLLSIITSGRDIFRTERDLTP